MNHLNPIFIHIPKTAGTSITANGRVLFLNHKSISETRATIGEWYWKQAIKFTVIRHPCDRLVSLYHWTVQMKPDHPWYPSMEGQRKFLSQFHNFEQFVMSVETEVLNQEMFRPISYYLQPDQGEELDFVLRYENLCRDWESLASECSALPSTLPRLNTSSHRIWQDHYTTEMLERMRSL